MGVAGIGDVEDLWEIVDLRVDAASCFIELAGELGHLSIPFRAAGLRLLGLFDFKVGRDDLTVALNLR